MVKLLAPPAEYVVAVWKVGPDAPTDAVLRRCVGYQEGRIDTRQKAAKFWLEVAVAEGRLVAGDSYEVDVCEDASDSWDTELIGVVSEEHVYGR